LQVDSVGRKPKHRLTEEGKWILKNRGIGKQAGWAEQDIKGRKDWVEKQFGNLTVDSGRL